MQDLLVITSRHVGVLLEQSLDHVVRDILEATLSVKQHKVVYFASHFNKVKYLSSWRGSVYKLVWSEYLIYLSLYYAISLAYRHGMSEEQMRALEQVSMFCEEHSSLIPLTFVLAFYVSHVVSRWWAQWNAIPWPDSLAMMVNTYCPGTVFLTNLWLK